MRRLAIALFSSAWLLPMWLAGQSVFTFLDAEVWPRLRGQMPGNSFPFLDFGLQAFTVGTIWLAAVVFYWTWKLSGSTRVTKDAAQHVAGADA